jgi:formylglycine-generating enzyme required for sulfatase activity
LETEVDALTVWLTLGLFILAVFAIFGVKAYPHLKAVFATWSWPRVTEPHLRARSRHGESLPPTFTNTIGMEFVLIPAGTFLMGTLIEALDAIAGGDAGYRDWIAHEAPQHRVHISQPFYLGTYPVTQAQWEAVMEQNPSRFKGNPNHPVEQVSWYDVLAFLRKLNALEGGRDYRLPTETQWEYACRAGTETPRYHEHIDAIAGYSATSERQAGHTYPVGQKLPNPWGLHDMLGNVWEWCRDGKRPYTADTVTDPLGPIESRVCRVIRGGVRSSSARVARAADRLSRHPRDGACFCLGFRCASSVTGR